MQDVVREFMGIDLEKTRKYWSQFLERLELYRKKGKALSKTSFLTMFRKAMKTAIKINQRRLFVISGNDTDKSLKYVYLALKEYTKVNDKETELRIVYSCSDPENEPELSNWRKLKSLMEDDNTVFARYKLDVIAYKNSQFVMGQTYNVAILDLTVDLHPNDIGRIIETVSGGGFIILLVPSIENFADMKTRFHDYITTIPWTLEHVPGRFIKFFIRKLFQNHGVYIIDTENDKILKEPTEPKNIRKRKRKPLVYPSKTILPKEIYEMAITQDQVGVISALENLLKKRDKREITVITADRGRGKSASVGIFLGAAAKINAGKGHLGRYLILVTAPEEYNVYTLFEFAAKTLEALGEKIKVYKSPPEIRGKGFVIAYYPPFDLVKVAKRDKPELIAVDEAAGIPVPLLFKYMDTTNKVIYSSTIHGYEGAGRGFSIRFIDVVKEMKGIGFKRIDMNEPIRYSSGDPIENLLYNVLLLKATPPKIDHEDLRAIRNGEVYLERVDLDKWFLTDQSELDSFIGIYVFAHYRNQPKDLGILADAPHYEAYALRTVTGKIVTAVLVAKEGYLPESLIREIYRNKEAEPAGHLIPVVLENHYRDMNSPKLFGVRIVRIATHPDVMRMGLGSRALKELEEIFRSRGFDWIGSGFGANPDLMRFWLKNKYVPLHISPKRNRVSGEYTVVVIKPLKEDLVTTVREYYREFRIRFVEWLRLVHYDIEPELARAILTGGYIWRKMEEEYILEPRLTKIQKKRLKAYLMGVLSYELTSDAINELVKNYFIDENPKKPRLTELQELILICRTLQARTLYQTVEILDLDKNEVRDTFRRVIEILYNHYVKKGD